MHSWKLYKHIKLIAYKCCYLDNSQEKLYVNFLYSAKTQRFCKNEYNLSGLCSRPACPLANSQYATIREENGIIYLYMRTPEKYVSVIVYRITYIINYME